LMIAGVGGGKKCGAAQQQRQNEIALSHRHNNLGCWLLAAGL
jgi:hypothetical protein